MGLIFLFEIRRYFFNSSPRTFYFFLAVTQSDTWLENFVFYPLSEK